MSLRIGVREGMKTINRNSSLFFLSLFVVAISLFLLSLFALLTANLYSFVKIINEKIEIIAFLEDHANVETLKANILKISGVTDVIYVSSEQALKDLRSELEETEEVLTVFEDNPLPASLRIRLQERHKNIDGLEEISGKVMLLRGVRETIYGGELVDELKRITNIISIFDIGLLLIIIFSVVFVIFQTIKLTIFARSTEIEIMKLVGASHSFIATPFTFEGLVQGVLGGFIAFGLTAVTVRVAMSFFNALYFPQGWFLAINVGSGVIFGILGSSIALRRFLK